LTALSELKGSGTFKGGSAILYLGVFEGWSIEAVWMVRSAARIVFERN